MTAAGHGHGDDKRAEDSAELVECLVDGERPAPADVGAGTGQHGVAGRGPNGFTQPPGQRNSATATPRCRDSPFLWPGVP